MLSVFSNNRVVSKNLHHGVYAKNGIQTSLIQTISSEFVETLINCGGSFDAQVAMTGVGSGSLAACQGRGLGHGFARPR
jgi:hypothetical protein